jgi:hypothetical protein
MFLWNFNQRLKNWIYHHSTGFLNYTSVLPNRTILQRVEKSNVLMLLQEERDVDCMYSNRSLEFFRIHIWFTPPRNWYLQHARVFDWQHICYVWWTCFAADSGHTFGYKLWSSSHRLQGSPDRNHKLWNIVSTERYILHMQVLLECCYIWTEFKFTTLVVIGINCKGSCKSNYHAITTAPT